MNYNAEPYIPDDTIEFSNIMLNGIAPTGEHFLSEIHIGGTVNSYFIGQLPQFQEFANHCLHNSTVQVDNYAYSLGRNPNVIRKASKEELERIIDDNFPYSYYDNLCIIEHEGPEQFTITNGVVESNRTAEVDSFADEVRLKNQARMASDMPACIELLRSLEHHLGTGKSLLGEWMQIIYEINPDFTEAPIEVAQQIVSAFKEVDRVYGRELARNLYYQADIVLPTEIVAAGRYLSVGGKYKDLHSLAETGWFMDGFQDIPYDRLLQAVNYMNNGGSADGIYDVSSTEASPNSTEQQAPGISR